MEDESHPQPDTWLLLKKKMFHWRTFFVDLNRRKLLLLALTALAVTAILMYQTQAMGKTDGKLQDAMAKIRELEEKLDQALDMIASLNDNKANKTTADQLTKWVDELEDHGERLAELERGRVDRTELEIIFGNFTSLKEATFAADEDIHQELSDLAATTLNLTHYSHLRNGIKLSQNNYADLLSLVTELSSSTVKTVEFHHEIEELYNTTQDIQDEMLEVTLNMANLVHDVALVNITLAMKADKRDLHQLSEKVNNIRASTVPTKQHRELVKRVGVLERQFTQLNDSLVAPTVIVDKPAETIVFSNVSATGVSKREFKELSHVVHDMRTRKANQSSVESLRDELQHLTRTKVEQWQIKHLQQQQNSAEEKHKNTLEKLSELRDTTGKNSNKIDKNRGNLDKFRKEFTDKNNATQMQVDDLNDRLQRDQWVLLIGVVIFVLLIVVMACCICCHFHN